MEDKIIDYIDMNVTAMTDEEEEGLKKFISDLIEIDYRLLTSQERIDLLAKNQQELNELRMKSFASERVQKWVPARDRKE